jgi:ribosome-associated protein
MSGTEEEAAAPSGGASGGTIRLDHFLKVKGRVRSGGEAKHRIQAGEVAVNGQVETRRSRKLAPGDRVEVDGAVLEVDALE